MNSIPIFDHKRGDNFFVSCVYKDGDGTRVSLDGITITSQVRTPSGVLVSDCVATVTDEDQGEYSLEVADTSLWPLGRLEWDIQYSLDGGRVISSETVCVNVLKDVTRP